MPMFPRTFASGGAGGVPDTFAPSVSEGEEPLTPAASPWVSPMKNAAPGLLQQTGETMMRAGDTAAKLGSTIGDRVQETMDDAQTKAAETQFLQASLPVLGQYKTTEGINATQQFDPAAQAISKARQDARTTLTNPIQQRMFDQVTNDHMLTFGQQMADHENVQRVQYGKDQAGARADNQYSLAQMAYMQGDMAGYTKYRGAAEGEVANLASLSGLNPGSDAAQAMLKVKQGTMIQGIVTGLHDRNAIDEEEQFFNAEAPNLEMRTRDALANLVREDVKQRAGIVNGQHAIMAALGQANGPGNLQPPIPAGTITTTNGVDGIDIHTAQGTPAHAPANGTVTKVWTDEQNGGGLSMEVQYASGYTAQFNHLSAANYQPGMKITQGQVLGLTGRDDNGQGVMHYTLADSDGRFIDPRQAPSAPWDPRSFNKPQDEEKAVDWINANISDPEEQRNAERYVRGTANTNRQIENQEHESALKQATDFWFQNGQSLASLPANVKMQLTPEDLNSFRQRGLEQYELGQRARDIGSVALRANWIEHPEQQTVDAVRQAYAQGQLSDNEYETAMRQAMPPGSTDKVLAASVDNEQIENTLIQNGHADIANAKESTPALQAQKVALYGEIKDQIDAEQQVSKRELTREQKQAIVDSTILNSRFLKMPGWFGSSTSQAPWELPPSAAARAQFTSSTGRTVNYVPIPPVARTAAIQSLIQRRQPISEQNIYDTWVNAGMVGGGR